MQQIHSTISDKLEASTLWNDGIRSAVLLIGIVKKCVDGVLGSPEFLWYVLKLVFVVSCLNIAHFKANIFLFMFGESAVLVSMEWRLILSSVLGISLRDSGIAGDVSLLVTERS